MQKIFLLLSTVLLVLLATVLGWLILFTEQLIAAGEALEWALFLGRFHPVVLHMPIGLFLGLFVIELLALRQGREGIERASLIMVWLMAITSLLTAYLGLLLASSGDYSGDTMWWHKWLGILFAASALLVTFFKVRSLCFSGKGLVLYRLLMLGLLFFLPVVGHFGGELTHGKGYLTKYAPEWLSDLFDTSKESLADDEDRSAMEENFFTQEVQPILEEHCASCHGPEKQKSKYRLDTYEYLMTPGSMEDTPVEPFSMGESYLLQYMLLPETDEMAMPPEGKPRPSAEEVLVIAHWIAMGAEGPPIDEEALAAAKAAAEAEQAEIVNLFDSGILLLPVGQDSDLLYLDFQNLGDALPEEALVTLAAYKERIYEVKLAGFNDAQQVLQLLEGAPELRVLNLSGLQNADTAVNRLNTLAGLEVLNLFASDLSGDGLAKLNLSDLQKLYIGSTSITGEERKLYQQSNPATQVYGDVDLATIEAIKAEDFQNSATFTPKRK